MNFTLSPLLYYEKSSAFTFLDRQNTLLYLFLWDTKTVRLNSRPKRIRVGRAGKTATFTEKNTCAVCHHHIMHMDDMAPLLLLVRFSFM